MPPTRRLQISWISAAALALTLVVAGWRTTPGVSLLSVGGALAILFLYGGLGYAALPWLCRLEPRLWRWIVTCGLLAGGIFLGETALEYYLLPADNTLLGQLEYGGAFLLFFIAGAVGARQSARCRVGVVAAAGSALLASLIWVIVVLGFFYTFRGTPQQGQVFLAEGNFTDFAASGMKSFGVWIMEDFLGAVFFHSLLAPLAAAVVGALGSLLGLRPAKAR
jgi:hypothetical protein